MAYFAEIDENNIVIRVLAVSDDNEENGQEFLSKTLKLGGRWIQTSYNTWGGIHYDPETGNPSEDQSKALRKNAASIGYSYNETIDAFIPPKPYESWVLNEDTCLWEAPYDRPTNGKRYNWNELILAWEEKPESQI